MKKKLNCIMLIDDDEATNFYSSIMIEEADCAEHVQIALNGKAALEYLTREEINNANHNLPNPDLIFLDINMPGMNGWEFLEEYHNLEKKCQGKIVIVMLSTTLNPDDKRKANEMPDIAGFESKPLTVEKLNTILDKFFPEVFSDVDCLY